MTCLVMFGSGVNGGCLRGGSWGLNPITAIPRVNIFRRGHRSFNSGFRVVCTSC